MKIGIVKRILKEDLAKTGEVPSWVDALIQPLNDAITRFAQALTNNLTLSDNMLGRQYTIELSHGVETVVNPQSRIRPLGILVLDAVGSQIDSYGMDRKQDGTLGITVRFVGGSSGTKATVTFFVLLGA